MHDNPFYIYSHMLAHETLRRHERMIPHIRVLMRHELDESRFAVEVGDGSGEDVSEVNLDIDISPDCEVRWVGDHLLLRLVPAVLDKLADIVRCDAKHQRALARLEQIHKQPNSISIAFTFHSQTKS
jgi:hypothetical protein